MDPHPQEDAAYHRIRYFLPRWLSGKEPACQCRSTEETLSSIAGSGSSPGGGHGNLQQYCCLENPTGRKELDVPEVTEHAHTEAPQGL